MFDIRDMQILVALDRHHHFARAADECGISQPAFSSRIRNLELNFNISIVKRGNRFLGFTPEGEIALKWARKILQDADGMHQELTEATTGLEGNLTLGVIPTALAFAARIPSVIHKTHPRIKVEITSASSREIKRGLENYTFSAGISYLEGTPAPTIRATLLYQEEYVLLTPKAFLKTKDDTISWRNVAELPLCLLSRTMRNRRIIEEIFSDLDISVTPAMETNALTVSLAQVEAGTAATIVPRALVPRLDGNESVAAIDIIDPVVQRPVALFLSHREPAPPAHFVLEKAITHLSS